ncbi:hypothetical protein [Flavobacterium sp. CS20]|uniref:hypothetical protein n=1 Tax=Flavobacterium sp. CS20 TaxID=2775246 RepID=UPI001B3A24B0|nr:hypothetical protein [Flavobacterium sp. CS20]QTY26435.1 hypothetical protein IGB25_10920 [Flavobacterium sp. CS20]
MQMKRLTNKLLIFLSTFVTIEALAQGKPSVEGNVDNLSIKEYTITLREEMINKAGKEVKGITINGGIPRSTFEFTEVNMRLSI